MEHTKLDAEYNQAKDGSNGEMTIDLDLPDNVNYDIDDVNGKIVVQWWTEE